jgi:hypothetical protein
MPKRKSPPKRAARKPTPQPPPPTQAAGLLERLAPEEADAVLRTLLGRHPGLRAEAEQIATGLVSSSSVEDIAADVFDRVTAVDIDALNERAGKHSWGYVEPSEAAYDLLTEAVEELVDDMKRKAELGLVSPAETVCVGLIGGLYDARHTESDGALGWGRDFPAEEAGEVVAQFIKSCPAEKRKPVGEKLLKTLTAQAPEWADVLERAVKSYT